MSDGPYRERLREYVSTRRRFLATAISWGIVGVALMALAFGLAWLMEPSPPPACHDQLYDMNVVYQAKCKTGSYFAGYHMLGKTKLVLCQCRENRPLYRYQDTKPDASVPEREK